MGAARITAKPKWGLPASIPKTADPTGAQVAATFDDVNSSTTYVDRTGAASMTSFNAAGNPSGHEDPLGNTDSTVWDSDGNPLTKTDSRGFVTTILSRDLS